MPAQPAPPAQQDRSRKSAERILAATLALLDRQDYEDISVAQIAARAGLSVGGFYARFPDKAALLAYLDSAVIDRLVALAQAQLSVEETRGLGLCEVIERYVSLAVRSFRKHKRVLAQVSARSRTGADPALRARIQQANRTFHDLFRARLSERLDEVGHRRPQVAIDVALTAVSGAMREYVLFPEMRKDFAVLSDRVLIAQLSEMACQYLRARPRK